MAPSKRFLMYMLLALLLGSISLSFNIRYVQCTQTNQVVFSPIGDTYIDSGDADINYGNSVMLATLSYNPHFGLPTRYMQSWLKFDLSSIPSDATIINATLTVIFSYTKEDAAVGIYAASSSWDENEMTWDNAPLDSVSEYYSDSQYVANSTTIYRWSLTSPTIAFIVGGSQGQVTLVLKPTSSQSSNPNGFAAYSSKESEDSSLGPKLTVTYSYVSASVSLSSNSIEYGGSVSISGSTDPVQYDGTMILQYSTDQETWQNITSQTGSAFTYDWSPPSAGTFYVKSMWGRSWSNGLFTYIAESNTTHVVVGKTISSVQFTDGRTMDQVGSLKFVFNRDEIVVLRATYKNVGTSPATLRLAVQVSTPELFPFPPRVEQITLNPGQEKTSSWSLGMPSNATLGTYTVEFNAFEDAILVATPVHLHFEIGQAKAS